MWREPKKEEEDVSTKNENPCMVSHGSGKIIDGHGVVCTEIIEKVKKCPACKGKGHQERI